MTESPNWADFYNKEADLKDYNPENDSVEIHRCRAVWSVFPRAGVESLLDAGCGNGFFCHWISRKVKLARVAGSDLSAKRMALAKTRYPDLEFSAGDITKLPFPDRSFDVVTCIEVLEHLEDPLPALKELLRVARRYVVVTVPDRQKVRQLLCPHCGQTFPEYGHIQSFDRARMEELARAAGGRVELSRLYFAPRGGRWGIPLWLGAIFVRALQWLRPTRATFLATRLVPER